MVKREKEKKKKEGKNISGRKLLRIPFVQGGRDRSITKKTRFRIHTDPGFLSLSILTARSFEKMMTKSFCRFTDASPEKCQPGCDYPNETKKKRKKKKKEGERGLKKRGLYIYMYIHATTTRKIECPSCEELFLYDMEGEEK